MTKKQGGKCLKGLNMAGLLLPSKTLTGQEKGESFYSWLGYFNRLLSEMEIDLSDTSYQQTLKLRVVLQISAKSFCSFLRKLVNR